MAGKTGFMLVLCRLCTGCNRGVKAISIMLEQNGVCALEIAQLACPLAVLLLNLKQCTFSRQLY